MNERKIALAVENCLILMDATDAPLVAELEYISQLEADDRWSKTEIKVVQSWIKKALDSRNSTR